MTREVEDSPHVAPLTECYFRKKKPRNDLLAVKRDWAAESEKARLSIFALEFRAVQPVGTAESAFEPSELRCKDNSLSCRDREHRRQDPFLCKSHFRFFIYCHSLPILMLVALLSSLRESSGAA